MAERANFMMHGPVALVDPFAPNRKGEKVDKRTPLAILDDASNVLNFSYSIENKTKADGYKKQEFIVEVNILDHRGISYHSVGFGRSIRAARQAAAVLTSFFHKLKPINDNF